MLCIIFHFIETPSCLSLYLYSDDRCFWISNFFAEFPTCQTLHSYSDGSQIIHEAAAAATIQMRRGPKMKLPPALSHSSSHPCCQCGKVYSWRTNLLRHLRLECGKKPHCQCPYCPYVTSHKTTVQEHIRRRHKTMPNIL